MIRVDLSEGGLSQVRFVTDPLWDVTASLMITLCPSSRAVHSPLVRAVAQMDSPALSLLRDLVDRSWWFPTMLAAPHVVRRRGEDVPTLLRRTLLAAPIEAVESDLRVLADKPTLAAMSAPELRSAVADAVADYWTSVLSPFWEVAEGLAVADITHRADLIARDGFGAVLSDLSPRIAFDGSALVLENAQIDHETPPGRGAHLIPSVFLATGYAMREEVSVTDPEDVPVICYPAFGAARLWEGTPEVPSPVSRLLGETRARVLHAVSNPTTTTELAAALDLPRATVNDHLQVLTAAGLTSARRHARRVYYESTAVAAALFEVDG